jgi:hypothetical protein
MSMNCDLLHSFEQCGEKGQFDGENLQLYVALVIGEGRGAIVCNVPVYEDRATG